jgi:flagellar biosynthesis/type III secretory pathway M-ring protein FliF/YscJ
MKLNPLKPSLPATTQTLEEITEIWSEWRRQKLPLYLFLALCFNLILAPVVYAASGNELTRTQSWALGLLGLGTVALAVYLFFVMFAPERF